MRARGGQRAVTAGRQEEWGRTDPPAGLISGRTDGAGVRRLKLSPAGSQPQPAGRGCALERLAQAGQCCAREMMPASWNLLWGCPRRQRPWRGAMLAPFLTGWWPEGTGPWEAGGWKGGTERTPRRSLCLRAPCYRPSCEALSLRLPHPYPR